MRQRLQLAGWARPRGAGGRGVGPLPARTPSEAQAGTAFLRIGLPFFSDNGRSARSLYVQGEGGISPASERSSEPEMQPAQRGPVRDPPASLPAQPVLQSSMTQLHVPRQKSSLFGCVFAVYTARQSVSPSEADWGQFTLLLRRSHR